MEEIGSLAEKMGYRAFLVGGIVRDILMGRENLDIDITVEGDAPTLVKKFATERGYRYHIYPEFMTAQLTTDTGLKVDFATTRKEKYSHPGAYPEVERATIEEDLFRRDFTINAMALEITEGSFGKLIDPFGGERDIKNKVIKILHKDSFVEDPIRILRALRFAGRFRFKLEGETERLLKTAVKGGYLQYAPTGRVNLELGNTLKEDRVKDILLLMGRYGVLESLGFATDDRWAEVLNRLPETVRWFKDSLGWQVDTAPVYLLSVLYPLPEETAEGLLEKYHFEGYKPAIKDFYLLKGKEAEKNSDLYKSIKNRNREAVVFWTAYRGLGNRIKGILEKEKEKPISGKDLKELKIPPSPLYREIIDDVFYKHLDGEIKDREEALRYIKQTYLSEGQKQ
ncbi:MAG: CCA tRNA nucleotidyltransferase [Aquificae bacterium]|nr:CCA tRNA nucleotidyltransferase [Aquificota bacterium]